MYHALRMDLHWSTLLRGRPREKLAKATCYIEHTTSSGLEGYLYPNLNKRLYIYILHMYMGHHVCSVDSMYLQQSRVLARQL